MADTLFTGTRKIQGFTGKMAKAELILYMGICGVISGYGGEGKFMPHSCNPREKERYLKCMAVVIEKLDAIARGDPWAHIEYGIYCILRNEQKAAALIEFAETNISGARKLIELIGACHGVIQFYRKLEFEGAEKGSKQTLIDKLKESGIEMRENYWESSLIFA